MLGSGVFDRYSPGMSGVPFRVEADPLTPESAGYVAAVEAILRGHFDQHPPPAPAEAAFEAVTLDEELTPEDLLAHLDWQRGHPDDVEFRGLSDPWTLVITLSLGSFLGGFLGEPGRRLFNKLLHPRGDVEPRSVIVRDADTGTDLHLRSRLAREPSDQAREELVRIVLPKPPKPPKAPLKYAGSSIVRDDRLSYLISIGVSFGTDEVASRKSGEALFAIEGDAVESEHDQWVLERRYTAEASPQEDAPTGRRWLRRPPKAKDESMELTLTIKYKWNAQRRRWILPR